MLTLSSCQVVSTRFLNCLGQLNFNLSQLIRILKNSMKGHFLLQIYLIMNLMTIAEDLLIYLINELMNQLNQLNKIKKSFLSIIVSKSRLKQVELVLQSAISQLLCYIINMLWLYTVWIQVK